MERALPGLALEEDAERDGVKKEDDGAKAFAVATIGSKDGGDFHGGVGEKEKRDITIPT